MDHNPAETGGARRGPSVGTIVGTGLVGFLLGGAFIAYLAWSGTADSFGIARRAAMDSANQSAPAAAAPDAAPVPGVAITQQQGGLDLRVASLEQRLARLDVQAAAVEGHTARAEALLVAFAARRAIERGAPLGYLEDQLRVRFGDAKPNSVAAVIDAANHPVTIDKLIGRLNALEPGLQQTSDNSSLAWVRQQLGELFIVRHESAPSPEPAKRLDRARLFLESGRVNAAIAEVRNMPGAAKADEWIADANRFARAQAALDLLETSALLDTRMLKDANGAPVA